MCGQTYNLRWVPNPNITSSDKLICQRDYNGTTDSIVAGIFLQFFYLYLFIHFIKGQASTTKSKRKSKRKRSKKNSCIKERSIVDNPLLIKAALQQVTQT